ncbi:hypothetical protein GCM10011369_06510 [Neiella marina]|uniref:Kazal-like domain-containing protein n=1 Tax=Neiella marina TaxID=508461 RepID=A0A8J2U2Q1_9GAMM|nr:hypothetical protein [Neiella marina]GGA67569.1 hypothetical protein GCM10011369_06510 [Neiella marina]
MKVKTNYQALLSCCAMVFVVTACQSQPQEIQLPKGFVKCPEPRPEICTMQYEPADGLLADGTTKSYGNACSACGDPQVIAVKKVNPTE